MDSIGELTGLSMDVMVTRLREVALYAHLHRITLENLETDHLDIFHRAVSRTLDSELAIETFAQIVDGLPIADVAYDKRYPGIFGDDHPIEAHPTLCPEAKEKACTCLKQYDLHSLAFDPQIVQAYQDAPLGSKAFHIRLIELVVIALHQIAVDLFKREDLRSHSQQEIDTITSCVMVPPKRLKYSDQKDYECRVRPRPTLFNHSYYIDLDIYPEGLADVVGYWAEDRIVGGIVLFDRKADPRDPQDRPSEEDQGGEVGGWNPPNIWLHSARDRMTDWVWQLRDDQQKALVDYLLAAPAEDTANNTLPILPHSRNRKRADPSVAHTHEFIFREYWDRKPATDDLLVFLRRRPGSGDHPGGGTRVSRNCATDFMDCVNALVKKCQEAKDKEE